MINMKIARARRALKRSWRALQGKPVLDPWFDVRSALPLTLGRTLIHWSENAAGHPHDTEFEPWKELLRKHGQALLDFADLDTEDIVDYDHPKVREAQDALRWAADNLLNLWD